MLACIFHFVVMIIYKLEYIWERVEEKRIESKRCFKFDIFLAIVVIDRIVRSIIIEFVLYIRFKILAENKSIFK
jgi:hypothetical protein